MYIVVNDAGHDLKHDNFSPDKSYRESEFALDIVKRIDKKLQAISQIKSYLTRQYSGQYLSLTERTEIANKLGANILISHHTNAFGNTWNDIKGLEIYKSVEKEFNKDVESFELAKCIYDELITIVSRGRGIKERESLSRPGQDYYTVIDKANCPAIIIEYGFHTNEEDLGLLKSEEFREKASNAVVRGICKYFGIEYKVSKYFKDIPLNHWCIDYVDKAKELEIISGKSENELGFGEQITKEVFVVGLVKLYDVIKNSK
jgi:N-acetylmuramoyl-L-alanine amidase